MIERDTAPWEFKGIRRTFARIKKSSRNVTIAALTVKIFRIAHFFFKSPCFSAHIITKAPILVPFCPKNPPVIGHVTIAWKNNKPL